MISVYLLLDLIDHRHKFAVIVSKESLQIILKPTNKKPYLIYTSIR